MPTNPYTAQRVFEQASKEAYKRNNPSGRKKCECEHEMRVAVKTKRMGDRLITLAQHGTKHFSTCQHSELARTTQPDKPKSRKPARVFVSGE